jgi:hypothetical protein
MVGRIHRGAWRSDGEFHVAIVRDQVGERCGLEEAIEHAGDTDPARVDWAVWIGAARASAQQTPGRPTLSEHLDDLLECDTLRCIEETKATGGAAAGRQYSGADESTECFGEVVGGCPHCRSERRHGHRTGMLSRELENGS